MRCQENKQFSRRFFQTHVAIYASHSISKHFPPMRLPAIMANVACRGHLRRTNTSDDCPSRSSGGNPRAFSELADEKTTAPTLALFTGFLR